jgi:peptidoglycan/LPS O-acetylase OafA/YrhL
MRNKRLDVLRCIAVILVMLHHAGIWFVFTRFGWVGVDLFFVLSGFLISGLLFSEFKRRGSVDFKRFFIRRGLKIYPAFYVFLFLTTIVSYFVLRTGSPPARYLHEVLFVQNYEHGTWDHTWTLAVEEHFYIFLPLFLLVLIRFSSNRQNPIRSVPWTALTVAGMCLAFRATSVYWGTPNFHMAYTATHERMDALFFGVLLGYLYHFHSLGLERVMGSMPNRLAIALFSSALLSLAYFLPRDDKFLATWGYTCVYLGCGGVLLLSLYLYGILPIGLARLAESVGSGLAFVGMYSYSVYLWHGPCAAWLPGLLRRLIHFPTGEYGRFLVYFVGSLVVGITMSRLIEYPVLRLRDRLFPPAQIAAESEEVSLTPAAAVAP